ncbi:MAG: DUF1549 domain-containing protein [Gemmataceae bacterium]|nr:DUF1549 domain-containing protein [Gemmataceae bacterium]
MGAEVGRPARIDRTALQEKGMWSFHNWVRARIRGDVPVDAFVRDIVTAEGSPFLDGPASFFQIGRNPEDWAETTTQLFLGVRVGCAECHHHPFEKWSQGDPVLGLPDGPRAGRAARRHAGHQPGEQPRAARRAGRRLRGTRPTRRTSTSPGTR